MWKPANSHSYITEIIQTSSTFEELRASRTRLLSPLIKFLTGNVHHPELVAALLALRSYYVNLESDDEPGINETRAYACEFIAVRTSKMILPGGHTKTDFIPRPQWRFVLHLSDREAIDYLLTELSFTDYLHESDEEAGLGLMDSTANQDPATPQKRVRIENNGVYHTPLRVPTSPGLENIPTGTTVVNEDVGRHGESGFAAYFDNLNALEIAAVSGAKKFLSQRVVQKMLEKVWSGDIVFWETLSVNSEKKPKMYNKKWVLQMSESLKLTFGRKTDPFSRLRVPMYLKFFEAVFFVSFLALYYAVLVPVQRNGRSPTIPSPPPSQPPQPPQPPVLSQQAPARSFLWSQDYSHANFYTISPTEVLLYIWIAGFAYDECMHAETYFALG
jgi:hypothetical protein